MNARTEEANLEIEEENHEPDPIELDARKEGWRPKEEWRGKPDDWIDAETFVKRGREINPILKKHNNELRAEIAAGKSQIDLLKKDIESLMEYNLRIEEQAYKRAKRELKTERAQAIKEGDAERVVELEDELESLEEHASKKAEKKTEAAPENKGNGKLHPVFTEWAEENSHWYNTENPKMMAFAEFAAAEVKIDEPGLEGRGFLDEVKKRVKAQFPDKFGGRRAGPGMTEGRGDVSRGTSSSLPPEARAIRTEACKQDWYKELAKKKGFKTPEAMWDADYAEQG